MKLYLMRHGQAASAQQDADKGLTLKGRAGIKRLAKSLSEKDLRIEQIFHSEKTRARQTAEIMGRYLAPTISLNARPDIQPNDDARLLLSEIDGWRKNTLITSHLPFVPSLLSLLSGDLKATNSIDFEPGAIISLEKQHNGKWHIEWVAAP